MAPYRIQGTTESGGILQHLPAIVSAFSQRLLLREPQLQVMSLSESSYKCRCRFEVRKKNTWQTDAAYPHRSFCFIFHALLLWSKQNQKLKTNSFLNSFHVASS